MKGVYLFILFILCLEYIHGQGPIRHIINPYGYHTTSPFCDTYCSQSLETLKNSTHGMCISVYTASSTIEGITLVEYEPAVCFCKFLNLKKVFQVTKKIKKRI
jgi:hypothetical protein